MERQRINYDNIIDEPEDSTIAIVLAFFLQLVQQLSAINVYNVYARDISEQFFPSLKQ